MGVWSLETHKVDGLNYSKYERLLLHMRDFLYMAQVGNDKTNQQKMRKMDITHQKKVFAEN